VLAYAQADVECDLYMEIPKGFEVVGENLDYVLKLKKNLFGQKQAGRVWNKHLVNKLESVGFKQSVIDECLFFKSSAMFILYTDDSICEWCVSLLKSTMTVNLYLSFCELNMTIITQPCFASFT
jgi:Reverse transcriptase (RNA-dependent DNA polymerase)